MGVRTVRARADRIRLSGQNLPVRQARLLGNQADHIHAETIYPLLAPPGHHGKDFLAHFRIVPVEVRLLL